MNNKSYYLLKDLPFEILFYPDGSGRRATGSAGNFLPDGEQLHKFFIRIHCEVDSTSGFHRFDIFAEGDFVEIFKKRYGISAILGTLKLKFSGSVQLAGVKFTNEFEVTSPPGKKIVQKFKSSAFLSNDIARQFLGTVYSQAKITLELMMIEGGPASSCGSSTSVEALTKRILQQKCQSDFTLIAQNDLEFPCHKCFLSAHSSFFQRMFETDCKETKSGKAKLNLSQEGLKAFLEFVYCLRIDTAKEDPKIALELLEFAHEKQISELEEEIKSIVVEKPDDWLSLNEGLQLFLFSLKLESQGYSDLKKKAVKAIKTKRLELKQSSVFQELLESNPKCVTEFVCSCLEF